MEKFLRYHNMGQWLYPLQYQDHCKLSGHQNWNQHFVTVRNSKKSSWPVTSLWNRGPLKILNGIRLILNDQGNHLDSYTISFEWPLFCKPVTGQDFFFAVFYSKPALFSNSWRWDIAMDFGQRRSPQCSGAHSCGMPMLAMSRSMP